MSNETTELAALFPGRSPEELQKAEENLRRYLVIVVRIYESIAADPESYRRYEALTEKLRDLRMETERSNFTNANHSSEA